MASRNSVLYVLCWILLVSVTSIVCGVPEACLNEKMFKSCGANAQDLNGVQISSDSDDFLISNEEPFYASPDPVVFTSEPIGGQYSDEARVNLSCDLQCGQESCPLVYWTLNGTNITDYGSKGILKYKTGISINSFDSKKEGVYACHTEDDKYSISSYPINLSLPRFTEWSDDVYDVPIKVTDDSVAIDITVSSKDAVILECSVKGISLPTKVQWSPQRPQDLFLPNGNLLVTELSKSSTVYICTNHVERNLLHNKIYDVQVVDKVDQGVPLLVATPKSQEVAVGQDVFLYCLAHSNATVHYQWYLDGESVVSSPAPQVMIIRNITRSGSYTCTAHNQYGNVSATAEVKAIGKPTPTISVISSSVRLKVFNGSTDLVLREYENIRITLNCSVDQADLDYKWYFRGQPVKGSGSLLNISGSDANSVIGSIQCFATGIGGRGQAYLRIVEDKGNAPSQLEMYLTQEFTNEYTLNWAPPIPNGNYTYRVQLRIVRVSKCDIAGIYQLNTTNTCLRLNLKTVGYFCDDFSVRLSSSSPSGKMSDWVYFDTNAYYGMVLQFPSDFKLTYSETEPIRERDHFTMELRYNTVSVSYPTLYNQCDDEVYRDRYLVAYCCSENCRNKLDNIQNDDPLIKYMLGRRYYTVNVACDTSCYWRAGVQNMISRNVLGFSDVQHFQTGDIAPSTAGTLTSVTWVGYSGTLLKVGVKLPPMNQSCNPVYLNISCGQGQFVVSAHTGYIDLSLSPESCWDSCPLSFTYNNSMGMSPVSNTINLSRPSANDISGFQSVWYNLSNESSINMFWTLSEGMDCLLKKEYIQQIAFWIKTKENPNINCSDVEKWPENMYYPLSIPTSGNLSLNLEESAPVQQEYCVKVQFTIYDSTRLMFYTMRSRYEVTPTTSSTMHPATESTTHQSSAESQPTSNYDQISTKVFLEIVLPVIILVMIVLVILFLGISLCVMRCMRKGDNSRGESESLLRPDGSEEPVRSKLPLGVEEESVITKYERIESYLKDVAEVNENGDEEETAKSVEEDIFNPVKPVVVQVITAEVNPVIEYECDENNGKKKVMTKKKASSERNLGTAIPSLSLLKERDCEAVQNASQSLASLLSSSGEWSDYQSCPTTGPALNQTRSSSYQAVEKVELQEFRNKGYEDLTPTTPTAQNKDLSSPCAADTKNTELHLDLLSPTLPQSPNALTPLAPFQPNTLQSPPPSIDTMTTKDTRTHPSDIGLTSSFSHTLHFPQHNSSILNGGGTLQNGSLSSVVSAGAGPRTTQVPPVMTSAVPTSIASQCMTKGPTFLPHGHPTTLGPVTSSHNRFAVQEPLHPALFQQAPTSARYQITTNGSLSAMTRHSIASPASSSQDYTHPTQKTTSSLSQQSNQGSFRPQPLGVSSVPNNRLARRVSDTACHMTAVGRSHVTLNRVSSSGYVHDTGPYSHLQQSQQLADSQFNARPSSQLSSGISSPSGSFESVFESPSVNGPGPIESKQTFYRHPSDCTSGICSPLYSPQVSGSNAFQFNSKGPLHPPGTATPTSIDYISNDSFSSQTTPHNSLSTLKELHETSRHDHTQTTPCFENEEQLVNSGRPADSYVQYPFLDRLSSHPLTTPPAPPPHLHKTFPPLNLSSSYAPNRSFSSAAPSSSTSPSACTSCMNHSDQNKTRPTHLFISPIAGSQGYLNSASLQQLFERSKSPDRGPSMLSEDTTNVHDVTPPPTTGHAASYVIPSLLSHSKTHPSIPKPHSQDQVPESSTLVPGNSLEASSSENLSESYSIDSNNSLLQEFSTNFTPQAQNNEYIEAPPS